MTGGAVIGVVKDAGIDKNQIQAAYVGNIQSGALSNQLLIQGRVWLRAASIGDIPVAATGVAQITELVWHLRGEVGERQIANQPKAGFAQIYGGDLRPEPVACATAIIKL